MRMSHVLRVIVSLVFLCGFTARATAEPVFFHVNPAGTYLFVDRNAFEPGRGDSAGPPSRLVIDPLRFRTGDGVSRVAFRRLGAFDAGAGFSDNITSLVGVFTSRGRFLTANFGAGLNVFPEVTLPTSPRGLRTDIPQDFSLFPSVVIAEIPQGATDVRFSPNDAFFSDNTDPNGDYGVSVVSLNDVFDDFNGPVVRPEKVGSGMMATFSPSPLTVLNLQQVAILGGFKNFNWLNTITFFGFGPGPVFTPDPSAARAQFGFEPPHFDPQLGGNVNEVQRCGPNAGADSFEWYFDQVLMPCQPEYFIDNALEDEFTLTFSDFPGFDNGLFTIASVWKMSFETSLVGVFADGSGKKISELFPGARTDFRWSYIQSAPCSRTQCGTTLRNIDPDRGGDGVVEHYGFVGELRDLAIIKMNAPKTVTLSGATPAVTEVVKVVIQNQGRQHETVEDLATLEDLVRLSVVSLGGCPPPAVGLLPPKRLPLRLAPGGKVGIAYSVTFDCANEPGANGGGDFSLSASLHREVIDGVSDADAIDDRCPRSVTAPFRSDPNRDGRFRDKGCGAKKDDGTFGGEVVVDVVVR